METVAVGVVGSPFIRQKLLQIWRGSGRDEALLAGADVLLAPCPFCTINLGKVGNIIVGLYLFLHGLLSDLKRLKYSSVFLFKSAERTYLCTACLYMDRRPESVESRGMFSIAFKKAKSIGPKKEWQLYIPVWGPKRTGKI